MANKAAAFKALGQGLFQMAGQKARKDELEQQRQHDKDMQALRETYATNRQLESEKRSEDSYQRRLAETRGHEADLFATRTADARQHAADLLEESKSHAEDLKLDAQDAAVGRLAESRDYQADRLQDAKDYAAEVAADKQLASEFSEFRKELQKVTGAAMSDPDKQVRQIDGLLRAYDSPENRDRMWHIAQPALTNFSEMAGAGSALQETIGKIVERYDSDFDGDDRPEASTAAPVQEEGPGFLEKAGDIAGMLTPEIRPRSKKPAELIDVPEQIGKGIDWLKENVPDKDRRLQERLYHK